MEKACTSSKQLIIISLMCCCVNCIILGDEEHFMLKNVLREYEQDSANGRYDRIIEIPFQYAKLIPKIFIWCPIRHSNIALKCPIHGCKLRVGKWTDVLNDEKPSPRNPRIIYDLNGNVILIQAFYSCTFNVPGLCRTGHSYLSASPDMLESLPENIKMTFPIILQQRSGFTWRLYDFLISSVYQGQNFMEVSEAIASMNYREFMRNNRNNADIVNAYNNNIFCSFPSNDKLMDLFLFQYNQNKNRYESDMSRHTGKVLSCDHTFKTSKHIGVTREDGKFIHQFENVFLGLNENGEVLTWRFTKSTSCSEVFQLLSKYKERLEQAGETLEMILVDDCCHVQNLYERIFPGVKIRLDIFHACARVVQTIPKSDLSQRQFSNEFSLIFRKDSDLSHERTMNTASPDEIEANLERLLFSWRSKLRNETIHQIDNLKKHIRKGCVSGIPVGCGTEANERLHRHLRRTMLCGVSKIGPELAVAIMTCVLYAWNCKRKGKTSHNKRTAPITPIEIVPEEKVQQQHLCGSRSFVLSSSSSCQSQSTSSIMDELKSKVTVRYVLQSILHQQDFLAAFAEQCKNKTVDPLHLLLTSPTTKQMISKECDRNTFKFDLTSQHNENLTRNLSGFDLTLDNSPKDGNCLFSSIVKQIYKHLERFSDNEHMMRHLSSLGWSLRGNEKDEAELLRQLFVDELTANMHEYRGWMSESCNEEEIKKFRVDGHFASDVGDLCVAACARLLKIPIVLITALPDVPSIPFLPSEFVEVTPMYIAFDHSGPGHYDATNYDCMQDPKTLEQMIPSIGVRCTCGKNRKDPTKIRCTTSACQCCLLKQPCTRKCRCFNCNNKKTALDCPSNLKTSPMKGCKCGFSIKDKGQKACRDGKRKTRCPCAARSVGCTVYCKCKNCGNLLKTGGKKSNFSDNQIEKVKRNRKTVSPYKRARRREVMDVESAAVDEGPWRILETLCLMTCIRILQSNGTIKFNPSACGELYRYVAESQEVKEMGLKIATKNLAQVTGKLAYLKKVNYFD